MGYNQSQNGKAGTFKINMTTLVTNLNSKQQIEGGAADYSPSLMGGSSEDSPVKYNINLRGKVLARTTY